MKLKPENITLYTKFVLKLEAVWFIPWLSCCCVPANVCGHKEENRAASMCSVLWLLIQLASELLAASAFDQTRSCFFVFPPPVLLSACTHRDQYGKVLVGSPPFCVCPNKWARSACNNDMTLTRLLVFVCLTEVHPPTHTPLHRSPHGKRRKPLMLSKGFNTMFWNLPHSGLRNVLQRKHNMFFSFFAGLVYPLAWKQYKPEWTQAFSTLRGEVEHYE